MKQDKFSRPYLLVYALGLIPVIWLALMIAPYMDGGIPSLISNMNQAFANPFAIQWCEDTPRTIVIMCLIYLVTLGIILSDDKNYRRREEYGSAKWGFPSRLNSKYATRKNEDPAQNKVLTQNVSISFMVRRHRRNLNILVIGGSGAGKTRFFALPNILNANSSFIILDPKGEILRTTGNVLKSKGYKIKVLDLLHMERSHCYNPFDYLRNYQATGRELKTSDEMRMLDNQYALLFIRGERPVMDLKYDLTKHPNFGLTPEGGGKPYIHGDDTRSFAAISLDQSLLGQAQDWEIDTTNFVLLSEEELEESFNKKEKENHETVPEKRKGIHRKAPRPHQG